jgi:hypothetical protein
MGQLDRAGLTGHMTDWADDHAEADFRASGAMARALDQASNAEDLEAADAELFEDDLLSLIQQRPSRHCKRV